MIRIGLIAAVLAVAAVVVPATARADEAGFLDRVHAAAMPLTDQKALTLGRAACTDLTNDIPLSAILAAQNPGFGDAPRLSAEQNWELLSAAVTELCPELRTGY
ncbi:MAG: DUF732 domain-containing protein [Mycobacterium sp.]